jgi:hypothetical protein
MSTITWLQVKEAVANNLGKIDGATFNQKREDSINRARRKYYSEKQWSFLRKVGTTLTFTAQVAPLPSDFNLKFNPFAVYEYDGDVKYEYVKVEWADIDSYSTAEYVYAIDPVNFDIKISQTSATCLIDYTYLPVDYTSTTGTQDTSVEPAPHTTAIELLGTAYYFMASRQSAGKYEQFLDGYRNQLQEDKQADGMAMPPRYFRRTPTIAKTGYRR